MLHGIVGSEEHWTTVQNFALQGTRASLSLLCQGEGWEDPTQTSIEILRSNPDQFPAAGLSGFLMILIQAAVVRSGQRLGRGVPPHETQWASPGTVSTILRHADRELALESRRREIRPDAPSRLTALWVAERSPAGHRMIGEMLGPRSLIFEVEIVAIQRMLRLDSQWIDLLHNDPSKQDAIDSYWSGEALDSTPRWEYLLDGAIAISDIDELERLRRFRREHLTPMFEDSAG